MFTMIRFLVVMVAIGVSAPIYVQAEMGRGSEANSERRGGGARGHRRPPREALEACSDKQVGEACSFTGRRGSESGTCSQRSADKPLACKPSRN